MSGNWPCHNDSVETVLDKGYTSTALTEFRHMRFIVAKKVPRYVNGIKASQRNCCITALGQYLYSSHVKLFKLLCFCLQGGCAGSINIGPLNGGLKPMLRCCR